VPISPLGEVAAFAPETPLSQEQVDRATSSLVTFTAQLPEDERAVIVHVLRQAAEAGSSS
jgi:hypothetical protein